MYVTRGKPLTARLMPTQLRLQRRLARSRPADLRFLRVVLRGYSSIKNLSVRIRLPLSPDFPNSSASRFRASPGCPRARRWWPAHRCRTELAPRSRQQAGGEHQRLSAHRLTLGPARRKWLQLLRDATREEGITTARLLPPSRRSMRTGSWAPARRCHQHHRPRAPSRALRRWPCLPRRRRSPAR